MNSVMNLSAEPDRVRVSGLDRLNVVNCEGFLQLVRSRLPDRCRVVELDCSTIEFIDSAGLGVLISLHKQLAAYDGRVRLYQPQPLVRELLHLLKLDEIFEIAT